MSKTENNFNTINFIDKLNHNINKNYYHFSESNQLWKSIDPKYKVSQQDKTQSEIKSIETNSHPLWDITWISSNIPRCEYGSIYSTFDNSKQFKSYLC